MVILLLHYSGAESTHYSRRSLDSAASPPPLANLCSLMRTCHQLQSPQLFMEAVVSLPIMVTVGVGSAFRVLHKMFLPACAVAEPEESPFPLHPGPDGDSCPVPNPTAAAKKASLCSWHTSGTFKGVMQC